MDEQRHFIALELKRFYEKFTKKMTLSVPRTMQHYEKAATICMELDATPEQYVASLVAKIGADKLRVEFLHCAEAKNHYKEYMSERALSLPDIFEVQMMYLRNQLGQAKRKVEDALMDDDLKFQPWFRICITKQPIEEVLDKYCAEAVEQMTPKLKQFLIDKKLDYKRITND